MFGLFFLSEGINAVSFVNEHGGEVKTTFGYS
jgi:creatinine amidohydrolase/Fe(II)-dependent formamide hydrolase-like protein